MKRLRTDFIYYHHSLSPDVSVDEIELWHKRRGFIEVGYHFVIRADGAIEAGRDLLDVGAHCKWHNWNSIGICFPGNFKRHEPTFEQLDSAAKQYPELCVTFKKTLSARFHRKKVNPCPGVKFDREEFMEFLAREAYAEANR